MVFRGKKGSFKIRLADNVVYYDYVNEAVARQVVFQCSLLSGRAWDAETVFLMVQQNKKYVKKNNKEKDNGGLEERGGTNYGVFARSELSLKRMGSSHDKEKATIVNFYQRILVQKYI